MVEDTSRLYVYVKDWEDHQPRADRPNLPWLRLKTSLLGSPAWLSLSCDDRCLLVTIWMLSQRYGHGTVMADQRWLLAQANVPHGSRSKNLERLVQAGFITLSTTKAEPNGGLEENRIEKEEKEKPAPGTKWVPARLSENGKPPSPTDLDDDLRPLDEDDDPPPLRDKRGYLI